MLINICKYMPKEKLRMSLFTSSSLLFHSHCTRRSLCQLYLWAGVKVKSQDTFWWIHQISVVAWYSAVALQKIMASLGFIAPPQKKKFRSFVDTKAPGPPLIYPLGPLAILDPHINICVRPPNTCVALKQFHLLPPNTSVWRLGWIKTCVKWFWDNSQCALGYQPPL